MLKNYLTTAIRFLVKNKVFSFINILGLSVGTLCCLYILLYVNDQYSYDKQHKNASNIYRINSVIAMNGEKNSNATSSPPIAPAMKSEFGEVVQFCRVIITDMMGAKRHLLRYKEKSFYETDADYVDSTFFDMFTYHFVTGTPANALNEPYSIVLQKPIADKLFGKEDPLDKMIEMEDANGKHDFKVTGVIDESLGKSHIRANMFITMNSGGFGNFVRTNTRWAANNFANSYVKLRPDANPVALEKKLPAFLNKYGAEQLKERGMSKTLSLQPVTSIHTTSGLEHEITKTVTPSFLYILLLIAVLIQIIACINFMNLSTARASRRAKEVGVRKVIGAGRGDLVRQFLGESFLLSLIGVLIALPLLLIALPYLNQITGVNIQLAFLSDYRLWILLLAIVVVTGLVAGSYPAFYLAAFQAIKVIKGNFTSQISAVTFRRSLVVFQFVLSIVLITGIIIIYSQLNYIKGKDLGFEKDQKLIFSFYTENSKQKMTSLEADIRQFAEVKSITRSDNYPSQFVGRDNGVFLEGGSMTQAVDVQNMLTDENFVRTTGIKIIAGRDFHQNDSNSVLINEALVRKLGLKLQSAPGTRLYSQYQPNPATNVEVAGVMKDFNYNSLHDEVKPFMLRYDKDNNDMSVLIVAVNTHNYPDLLNKLGSTWSKNLPEAPFEYAFLDDEVQKQYDTEITLGRIINSFAFMAIFISCLGLFGLAAFSAEQRRKEIGVRKVLGAGVFSLVNLLSQDFLKLVGIAILVAAPIAWAAMHEWLQQFSYRISMSWWMFAIAGLLAILIALLTVSFQAIKAAIANPVKSLRTE